MITRIGAVLNTLDAIQNPDENHFDTAISESNGSLLKNPNSRVKIKNLESLAQLIDLEPAEHYYTQNEKYFIQAYSGQLWITELRFAMKAGKECKYIVINDKYSNGLDNVRKALFDLIDESTESIDEFFGDTMDSYEFNADIQINVNHTKAKQVFSPFTALKLKRLDKTPKKWTVDHLAKVIANGQYVSLTREGRDNADPIEEVRALVQRDVDMSYSNDVEADGTQLVTYAASRRDHRKCIVDLTAKH
jgi:hypothetical protein